MLAPAYRRTSVRLQTAANLLSSNIEKVLQLLATQRVHLETSGGLRGIISAVALTSLEKPQSNHGLISAKHFSRGDSEASRLSDNVEHLRYKIGIAVMLGPTVLLRGKHGSSIPKTTSKHATSSMVIVIITTKHDFRLPPQIHAKLNCWRAVAPPPHPCQGVVI